MSGYFVAGCNTGRLHFKNEKKFLKFEFSIYDVHNKNLFRYRPSERRHRIGNTVHGADN